MMKEVNIDVAKTLMISALISIMTLNIIHRMILQSIFSSFQKVTENHLRKAVFEDDIILLIN